MPLQLGLLVQGGLRKRDSWHAAHPGLDVAPAQRADSRAASGLPGTERTPGQRADSRAPSRPVACSVNSGHPEALAADRHHITPAQLPTTAILRRTVDQDPAPGQQQFDIRPDLHGIGEFQELAQPDTSISDRHVAHATIIAVRLTGRRGGVADLST
jgi:hypothetical protein